jgi:hypothetical protein
LQFLRLRSGSSCVLHATSFISSFVPLHYTSFVAKPFASYWASRALHKPTHMGMHQPFASQRYNTHRVSFRFTTSSIHFSSVQSTRCQLFLLAGSPTSAAFTLRLLIAHSYLISQSIAKVHLHSSAAYVPFGKFTPAASYGASIVAATWQSFFSFIRKVAATLLLAPSWGLAGNSVRSSLHCLRAARRYATVPTSVRHSYAFFLLRAVLPAGLPHLLTLLRNQYPAKNTFSQCIFSTYPGSSKLA